MEIIAYLCTRKQQSPNEGVARSCRDDRKAPRGLDPEVWRVLVLPKADGHGAGFAHQTGAEVFPASFGVCLFRPFLFYLVDLFRQVIVLHP